jgi:hypothetical protein
MGRLPEDVGLLAQDTAGATSWGVNCIGLRIPTYPVGCSNNIRSVIPEYPVT